MTWRQHRTQALAAVGFLVVIGGLLLVHGMRTAGLADAFAPGSASGRSVLGAQFGQVSPLLAWSAAVPALIGLFWGTPLLAREFERGTHLLAWTQSVPRRAWLGVKLVALGGAVAVAGLVFGAVMSAWADGFSVLTNAGRLANQDVFAVTGIVPAAWWLFAFAVGVAAGAVTRRILSAMAVTLVVFLLAYFWVSGAGARLHYAAPERVEETAPVVRGEPWLINTPSGAQAQLPGGALLVTSGWVDAAGTPLSYDATWACASTSDDYLNCMRDKGFEWFADYHPSDRYWRFQWTEAGLLASATVLLGALAWRRAR